MRGRIFPGLTRWALIENLCILIRQRQRMFWYRHTQEKAMWRWRWWLDWCSHELRKSKDARQSPKAGRCKKWIPATAFRGSTALLAHLFQTFAFQIVKWQMCYFSPPSLSQFVIETLIKTTHLDVVFFIFTLCAFVENQENVEWCISKVFFVVVFVYDFLSASYSPFSPRNLIIKCKTISLYLITFSIYILFAFFSLHCFFPYLYFLLIFYELLILFLY